jgi:hypothetical protein
MPALSGSILNRSQNAINVQIKGNHLLNQLTKTNLKKVGFVYSNILRELTRGLDAEMDV